MVIIWLKKEEGVLLVKERERVLNGPGKREITNWSKKKDGFFGQRKREVLGENF